MKERDVTRPGKCRIIKDPEGIRKAMARLGRKYVPRAPRQPAPCNGNKITLTFSVPGSGKKEERTFSDSGLLEILERQRATTEGPRCTKKQLGVLGDFREMLSKKGAEAFTGRQKAFLAVIIQTSEGNNPDSERYEANKKRVSALLHFQRSKGESLREDVENFFSSDSLTLAIIEVAALLEPHGVLIAKGPEFVYMCGARMMDRFFWIGIEGGAVPVRGRGRALLRALMAPESDALSNEQPDIAEVPKRLKAELTGVPENSPELATDILESVLSSFSVGKE